MDKLPEMPLKRPRVIKVVTLFTIILVIAAVLFTAISVKWATQSPNVLEVKNSPVPVHPPEVPDGGAVTLSVDFCKRSKNSGQVALNLIGKMGAKIAVVWPPENLQKVCSKDMPTKIACTPQEKEKDCIPVRVPIPAQTPSDTYHAEFNICYNLNPFKKPCVVFTSKEFRVINSKLNPGDAKSSQL